MVQPQNGRAHKTRRHANGVQLSSLTRRRERIIKELLEIEQRIAVVAGKSYRLRSRRRPKRPKNSRSLHEIVIEILQRRKSGVALDPLSRQVLSTGYRTSSSDFKNVLRQCLYHSAKVVHRPEDGRYYLKGSA